ncbi:HNH endonuclease signature motif containing protein, partial [Microbacterium karelineae]|uniref:HNH endonuclease signature motif containing protein n=1 Tax=Microbacterium karelineae TaxID=2654283 RepID=UPI001E5EB54B
VAATDLRSMDQLRVDILADILLTSAPTGHELHASGTGVGLDRIQAAVQVTIPASQILDPDAGTARVDEGGIIAPDAARRVAGGASGWDRLFVRPESGRVIAVDRYRPSPAQRRALIGRDVTCRFPGCTTPARKADIDHSREYARGGLTEISNMAHLCEAHHVMKHNSGWGLKQVEGGVLEWTSPAGRVYRDEPLGRVFFQDIPEHAPGSERPRGAAEDPVPAVNDARDRDAQPGDMHVDDAQPSETQDGDVQPGDVQSSDAQPGDMHVDEATGDVLADDPWRDMMRDITARARVARAFAAKRVEDAGRDDRNRKIQQARAQDRRDDDEERADARMETLMNALTEDELHELAFGEAIASGKITDPAAGWWDQLDEPAWFERP